MACQSHSCPLRPRVGVGHNGPCHCLDGLSPEVRAEVRSALLSIRALRECQAANEQELRRADAMLGEIRTGVARQVVELATIQRDLGLSEGTGYYRCDHAPHCEALSYVIEALRKAIA